MSAPGLTSRAYDSAASWYDAWHWQNFWGRNEEPLVRACIARTKGALRAIDVGVGTGRYAAILRRYGLTSYGIDSSKAMLEIASAKLKGSTQLFHGDASSRVFPPAYFDIAIAARVFCHIEDIKEPLHELARTLNSGGTLIVTELDNEHHFDETRIPTSQGKISIATWKRSPKEVIRDAESVGWQLTAHRRVHTNDCLWLPEQGHIKSIDRSKNRPIFNVITFRRI